MSLTSAIQTNQYEKRICDYPPPRDENNFLECAAPDDAQDFREYRRLTHVSFRSPPPSPPASSKSDIPGKDITVALLVLGGGYLLGGPVGLGLGALLLGGKGCYPVERVGVGRERDDEFAGLEGEAEAWVPTDMVNVPLSRNNHTAVWTGSGMIVWGGYGGVGNTGGLYEPVLDRWTPTSTTNAPSERTAHTAVWGGSQMIIWGGWEGDFLPGSGGLYDPHADRWDTINPYRSPSARSLHTAVWTGSEMIIWGGQEWKEDDYGLVRTGGRFDPDTNTWRPVNPAGASLARILHTAVWTGSEMIVWGGSGNGLSLGNLNDGGRYDPIVDRWAPRTSTTGAPSPRGHHTVVWTGSEMIVWGGIEGPYDKSSLHDTGGRYDPVDDTWLPTSTANAPSARVGHAAVWTGSAMIVWGGQEEWNAKYDSLKNDGGVYDPVEDRWGSTSMIDAPLERVAHTAVWTGSEMIVWGGEYDDRDLDTGGRYTP